MSDKLSLAEALADSEAFAWLEFGLTVLMLIGKPSPLTTSDIVAARDLANAIISEFTGDA